MNAALDAQRTASGMVNAVTAEQIQESRRRRRTGGEARQRRHRAGWQVRLRARTRRALHDGSLNGARVPSPEPEKRVVPLDMFPAGLLQTITTTKTFTPDLQGDFSGALVDIKTREFPGRAPDRVFG